MTLTPRTLGATDVRLSPLTFGSMRLETRSDDAEWVRLLAAAHERGVTTLHSSTEYDSFGRFCTLLTTLDATRFQHVVKLAEPHFGDADFDEPRLVQKVDDYLTRLGAPRLDVVQWMWRGDLKNEPGRLAGVADRAAAMAEAFGRLRQAGKIGAVAPFPYTAAFADACLASPWADGLTVYLNPVEQELRPQVDEAARQGRGIVALRPLAAGKALQAGHTAAACIQHVLATPAVATAVVSFSSLEHLAELEHAIT